MVFALLRKWRSLELEDHDVIRNVYEVFYDYYIVKSAEIDVVH